MNKIGKDLNPENIERTPWYINKIINIFCPKRIKELADTNTYIANVSKTFFDNRFGEKNYTVIAIGRSVASITENMGILGADVKMIPMSGLRDGLPSEIKDVDVYKKYLKSINLDEASIDKSPNRKFILFDYVDTGTSLSSMEQFLNKYIFNGKKDNLIKVSINEILKNDNSYGKFVKLFAFNRFKLFSPVGKLDISELKHCVKQSKPESMDEYHSSVALINRRLFLFNVLKKTDNLTISMPVRELEAIYNHNFSSNAMRAKAEAYLHRLQKIIQNYNKNEIRN